MSKDPSQFSLLDGTREHQIIREGGDVRLIPNWLSVTEADAVFASLYREITWQSSSIRIGGRGVAIPRLNAWYGEPGCRYRYSGIAFEPLPWTATLGFLREKLQESYGLFNSVLVNLYRDGRDSVAWHSDNEPELGTDPTIASISLGAVRRFRLKHKTQNTVAPVTIDLPNGSLLLMAGGTQRHWVHQLSKTAKPVGARINLTFRYIYQ